MSWITTIDNKFEKNKEKPPPKRRTRGPRPRGPKPQVCDLCQLRKVKCDKVLPRCSLCQRLNKPCTYDRSGFGTAFSHSNQQPSEKDLKLNRLSPVKATNYLSTFGDVKSNFIWTSIQPPHMILKRHRIFLHKNGTCSYFGQSMATFFFISAPHLLKNILNTPNTNYQPVVYNKNISVEITRTLILQLVELYFSHLNSFFPLLDPTSFYSKLNGVTYDLPFRTLLSGVCLSGSAFYPNRTFGRIIAIYFSKQLRIYLKKIYNKPNILTIQTYILCAYCINLCEDEAGLDNSWYYLGIAKCMLKVIGSPRYQPKSTKAHKDLIARLWWVAYSADIVASSIFGRPPCLPDEFIKVPSEDVIIPSVTYACPNIFIVKELIDLKPESNAAYFKHACQHLIFVAEWCILRERLKDKGTDVTLKSMHSLSAILEDFNGNNDSQNVLEGIRSLERRSMSWYINLVNPNDGNNSKEIRLPDFFDLYNGYLAIMHFSFLIDLNKQLINEDQIALCEAPKESLKTQKYYGYVNLEKCILAAFFGTRAFINIGDKVSEIGVPYVWYSCLQFIFIFVYIIKSFDKNHWAIEPAKRNGYYLFNQFEIHSDRWVIIRDVYSTLQSAFPEGKNFFK